MKCNWCGKPLYPQFDNAHGVLCYTEYLAAAHHYYTPDLVLPKDLANFLSTSDAVKAMRKKSKRKRK